MKIISSIRKAQEFTTLTRKKMRARRKANEAWKRALTAANIAQSTKKEADAAWEAYRDADMAAKALGS